VNVYDCVKVSEDFLYEGERMWGGEGECVCEAVWLCVYGTP